VSRVSLDAARLLEVWREDLRRRRLRSFCGASFLQNVYGGKRSFDTAITAEGEQYQSIRRQHGFRKIDTIKSGSTMTDDVTALIEEIQRYARNRAQDVSRGAETPALAALMIEKFGEGLVKAGHLLGVERVDALKDEISRLVRVVDAQYPKHLQYRFEARPAGLAINGESH
jgi:hypothetical protein